MTLYLMIWTNVAIETVLILLCISSLSVDIVLESKGHKYIL